MIKIIKFGSRIRELGERIGKEEQQIAKDLDLTKSQLSHYINGRRKVPSELLQKIVDIYDINPQFLFREDAPLYQEESSVAESSGQYEVNKSTEYNYYPTAISAGLPYEVDGITQKDIQKLSIPDAIMGKHAGDQSIMLMRVNGDSMNKTMPDQSLIAVKPVTLDQLSNDDIVVYSYNHEYSVKYYYKDGDEIIFRPHSTDRVHRDTVFNLDDANELHIHGKVVMYIVDRD